VDPLVLQRVSDAFERALKEDKKMNQNETNAVRNSGLQVGVIEEDTLQGANTTQSEAVPSKMKVIQSKLIESKLKNETSLTSTTRSRDKGSGGTNLTSKVADIWTPLVNRNHKAINATRNSKTLPPIASTNPSANNIANPESHDTTLNSNKSDDGYEGAAKIGLEPGNEMQMRASHAIVAVADGNTYPTEIETNAEIERVEKENHVESKVTVLERGDVGSVKHVDGGGHVSRTSSSQISTAKGSDILYVSDHHETSDTVDRTVNEIAEEIEITEMLTVETAILEGVVNKDTSIALDMIQKVKLNKVIKQNIVHPYRFANYSCLKCC
jgi:hypothetical protein